MFCRSLPQSRRGTWKVSTLPLDRTTFLSSALPAFVLPNLGVADYNALQTNLVYRGNRKLFASLSYTLSKATNTTEPDATASIPTRALSRVSVKKNVDQAWSINVIASVVQFHEALPKPKGLRALHPFADEPPRGLF